MAFVDSKAASTLGHTFRNFDHAMVTVHVGSPPETFSAHRELLRRCSPFFASALDDAEQRVDSPYAPSSCSSSAASTTLDLPDTAPDVFDAFMMWLYTGVIPHHLIEGGRETAAAPPPTHARGESSSSRSSLAGKKEDDATHDVDTASWGINLDSDAADIDPTPASPPPPASLLDQPDSHLATPPPEEKPTPQQPPSKTDTTATSTTAPPETLCPCCQRPYKWRSLEGFLERRFTALYVFAWRYSILPLRRAVMLCWQLAEERHTSMPTHADVIAAYASLPAHAPLCRYFLDMYAVYWDPDADSGVAVGLRKELPQAFLFELATSLARGERQRVEREWCAFHEHVDEGERKACIEGLGRDAVAKRALQRIRDSKGWKGVVWKKGKR